MVCEGGNDTKNNVKEVMRDQERLQKHTESNRLQLNSLGCKLLSIEGRLRVLDEDVTKMKQDCDTRTTVVSDANTNFSKLKISIGQVKIGVENVEKLLTTVINNVNTTSGRLNAIAERS